MPRPDGKPTIQELHEDMAVRNYPECLACGKSLGDPEELKGSPAYRLRLGGWCSKECQRKDLGKNWPEEEDCPGCPAHQDGPHKMSCSARKGSIRFSAKRRPDGTFEV